MKDDFVKGPSKFAPWVWYHMMGGNITQKGLKADLEAMKHVGIGGFTIFDMAQDPKGPVEFSSPEYSELLHFAIAEAGRLGLEVEVLPGSGYSTGGPWITPELSMLRVVYSEITVEGGKDFDQLIPQPSASPPAQCDYYRDIALLAYPSLDGEGVSFKDFNPEITTQGGPQNPNDLQRLFDGKYLFRYKKNDSNSSEPYSVMFDHLVSFDNPSPEKPVFITMKFEKPFTARSFSLGYNGGLLEGVLESSDDGKAFTPLVSFTFNHPQFQQAHNFSTTTASYYRLRFTNAHGRINLSEFELLSRFGVDDYWGKIHEGARQTPAIIHKKPDLSGACINPDKLIDLTKNMSKDGRLRWKAPAGKWTILRVGYSPVGIRNRYGRLGGEGLETDKLAAAATDAQWQGFMAKLIKDIGPLNGKVLKGMFIDSHETGFQNWTPAFIQEFINRRGYDPVPFLPVICNRIVDNPDASDRFAWDFRRTISELMTENYTGRLAELCEQNDLQFSIQPHGEGIVDHVTMGSKAHVPAANFWVESASGDKEIGIAHVYGREVISAEALTHRAKWDVDPYRLKQVGDNAFAIGINQFKFHSYVHQPWMNRAPGMGFSVWGMCFNRNLTWWEQSKPWVKYITRCQYLLRQGLPVADLTGYKNHKFYIPPLIKHHPCNYDAIETRMSVADGKIVLPDGMSYRILTLKDSETMTPSLIKAVRRLVKAGATVVGPKPLRSPSLENQPHADMEITTIADEVWGDIDGKSITEHKYGKGRVVWGKPIWQLLNELGIQNDFEFNAHGLDAKVSLGFNHRRTEDIDFYYVHNKTEESGAATCTFRVNGKVPELWYPDTGKIESYPIYWESGDGRTVLPLRFDPYGSFFVVFRNASPNPSSQVLSVKHGDVDVLTANTDDQSQAIELQKDAEGAIVATVSKPGKFTIGMADGTEKSLEVSKLPTAQELSGSWELRFPKNWGAPEKVLLPKLLSWTEHENPGVRYFSGTATYSKQITVSEKAIGPQYRTVLDLGHIKNVAQVFVNGKDCGIVWKKPFIADITDAVKAGQNRLEIQITNLWPNRLIGDEQQFPGKSWKPGSPYPEWLNGNKPDPSGKLTFTTHSPYTQDSPLMESGLLGPVRILTNVQVKIE